LEETAVPDADAMTVAEATAVFGSFYCFSSAVMVPAVYLAEATMVDVAAVVVAQVHGIMDVLTAAAANSSGTNFWASSDALS
jgi:hypothetical protein